jgi:hypothetical protein
MFLQKINQAVIAKNIIEMTGVQESKPPTEISLQDERDRGAGIFENVVVQKDARFGHAPVLLGPTPHSMFPPGLTTADA